MQDLGLVSKLLRIIRDPGLSKLSLQTIANVLTVLLSGATHPPSLLRYIPRTKLNLGKHAFSVAAPDIWNELPTTLNSCESLASFRKISKRIFSNLFFDLK